MPCTAASTSSTQKDRRRYENLLSTAACTAPFLTEPAPENPAGAWKDLRQQQDPLRYVLPLLEEALPPFRHPALVQMREGAQCSLCALHYDLLGQELGLADRKAHRRTQQGGALFRGGAQVGEAPPAPLPHGKERQPDWIEPWDTRFSEGERAAIKCDGPCRKKRSADSGAFRDARMRQATICMRPVMWGTGAASGIWHCGLCLQQELQKDDEHVPTPMDAVNLVRRSPSYSVPEDPMNSTDGIDPISREVITAPADVEITRDTPLEQLLIDTEAFPKFNPVVARNRVPPRTGDTRFGGGRAAVFRCDGCQKRCTVRLVKGAQPAGAFLARQHKRRRNRTDNTLPCLHGV